ncbi:2-(3-amino-3-carboxypropyl)histidine synthase subunit 1-like [Drosophila novamexicana]|uniref:2-(3-amino-3-carboxypropyl)histidine synthase subunit 1-like n=1 Tax=Drosophila novamexicana TaxID=47314 RepID=UPI0011E5EDB9|nr:2-(3-amino-3-carboxypropyl)histidine synthase subunit 1-like [Drosophila novamexicana]
MSTKPCKACGITLGTLGRQGSARVHRLLEKCLHAKGIATIPILLSEIFPQKLALFADCIDAYVQIARLRLSINCGSAFEQPLLNPYELSVVLGDIEWTPDNAYPMDFYASGSLGPWTPNFKPPALGECKDREIKQLQEKLNQRNDLVIEELRAQNEFYKQSIKELASHVLSINEQISIPNSNALKTQDYEEQLEKQKKSIDQQAQQIPELKNEINI